MSSRRTPVSAEERVQAAERRRHLLSMAMQRAHAAASAGADGVDETDQKPPKQETQSKILVPLALLACVALLAAYLVMKTYEDPRSSLAQEYASEMRTAGLVSSPIQDMQYHAQNGFRDASETSMCKSAVDEEVESARRMRLQLEEEFIWKMKVWKDRLVREALQWKEEEKATLASQLKSESEIPAPIESN